MNKAGIHELEDALFAKYKARLDSGKDVAPDGLHYSGEFFRNNGQWGRDYGDEEEKWRYFCEDRRGVVVITKDLNDKVAWDIREEHFRVNESENVVPSNYYAFYRNLRRWVYGLINMDRTGIMPEYPDTYLAQSCVENAPWVRINLKKVPGSSSVSNVILSEYISNFRDLLLEQLRLYEGASIYLDCTRRNGIGLLKEIYPDIVSYGIGYDEWIYYSEDNRFIIVNSYHPSYRFAGGERAYYGRMREAVRGFFREHPDFFVRRDV